VQGSRTDLPKCATGLEPNLVAFCESSSCTAHDLRSHPFSACSEDDDCMLRHPARCEPCAPDPFALVAIAKAHASDFQLPSATRTKHVRSANLSIRRLRRALWRRGALRGSRKLVPTTVPSPEQACSDPNLACEYGEDPRIHHLGRTALLERILARRADPVPAVRLEPASVGPTRATTETRRSYDAPTRIR
jgi:hypothetical protein